MAIMKKRNGYFIILICEIYFSSMVQSCIEEYHCYFAMFNIRSHNSTMVESLALQALTISRSPILIVRFN